MRNLLQYPVTVEEKLKILQSYYDSAKKEQEETMICGDMTTIILSEIIEDVKRAKG